MKLKCECGREVELVLVAVLEKDGTKFYQWEGKCECGWEYQLSGVKES